MTRKTMLASLASFLAATAALATPPDLWLHVTVVEAERGGETVKINLPLSTVEKVLPLVDNEHVKQGKVKITGDVDLKGADLHGIWEALRETPDGDFVTVDGSEGKVRVSKTGTHMLVLVDGGRDRTEKVEVKVPLAVVDALFSADPDELNVLAALSALKESGEGELVRVSDGSSKVRIWVDAVQNP